MNLVFLQFELTTRLFFDLLDSKGCCIRNKLIEYPIFTTKTVTGLESI